MNDKILSSISETCQVKPGQVSSVLSLTKEGGTIPFIARYRKDITGNLDEVQIEQIIESSKKLEELQKRKVFILSSIKEQGKLSPELNSSIESCWDDKLLEDYYLPFKQGRKTKADIAIEKGLEPLAKIIMAQNSDNILSQSKRFNLPKNEALEGAYHIAAQWISERSFIRNKTRMTFERNGTATSKVVKSKENEAGKFKDYFDFSEPIYKLKSHRIHALLRGSKAGYLKVKFQPEKKETLEQLNQIIIKDTNPDDSHLKTIIKDAYQRLLAPSMEKEIIKDLKCKADEDAIKIFGKNLKQLLLQPPLGASRILAIDPGFRSGCKVVCLDEMGSLLHNETIYPHPPQSQKGMAKKKISTLVEQFEIESIAIGNGTASRETERFIKGIRFDRKLKVFIVNEAGASVYSASKIAREEFPQYDVTVRGAVSIGRRLIDPLAELVKIDPKSIGVGQYQHDVNQKQLQQKLDGVVMSAVNSVGVDLNTASKYLLTYVSGIGPSLAENIIQYREENGNFSNRKDLKKVKKLGDKAYEQCAGFMKVKNGDEPLDNSNVHPESYNIVKKMAKSLSKDVSELIGNKEFVDQINPKNFIDDQNGASTVKDILEELEKPGRDPRKHAKMFEFDKSIRKIEDLEIGYKLPGIVNNITNFGAFIDIGIKENGLIHISHLSDGFVSDPTEVINLHEHVMAEVISIDVPRKRIGLKRLND